MFWIKGKKGMLLGIEYVLLPLSILFSVIVASVLLLASPVVWSTVYLAPAGLPHVAQEDGEKIGHYLWSDKPYTEVSQMLNGGRLGRREVNHYEDLQRKIKFLIFSLIVVGGFSLGAILVMGVRRGGKSINRVLGVSLLWLTVFSFGAITWALYDWRDFFESVHWWLFQNDSWRLPNHCYSLQLYPYEVWKKMSIVLLLIASGLYSFLLVLASSFKVKDKFFKKR